MPVTTTNSINSYKPLDSGLDRSLSGSNTSLCSIKSAREPLTYASNHSLIKSTYSSIHGNGQNSLVELEKSKSKIRKLEKQVNKITTIIHVVSIIVVVVIVIRCHY